MKKNLQTLSAVIIFSLFTVTHLLADHITVQGTVSGEWAADTVFVSGDLLVADGQSLVIRPGAKVIFNGVFEFRVEGALTAAGTATDSICFLMADTTGFAVDSIPDGGWRGIRFDRNRVSNDSSLFLYCHFAYGKRVSDDPAAGNGGAIFINDFHKVRVGHSLFRDNFATFNGGAVYLDSANVSIHDCTFIRNRCGLSVAPWGYGGAIGCDNSSPEIRWNVFEGNSSTGIGGGVSVRFADCNLYNNIFTGNFSALGGALGVLHIPECTHRINNNLFAENTALYFGGGVANLNASPIYINNTIVFNQSTYGGGFYCKDSVSPDFYNTIIWGNMAAVGPQGYLFEVYSQADFFNCDVEGGPMEFGGSGGGEAFLGAYESCIEEDPLFEGSGLHPFALTAGSPCIDAGSADTTGFYLPLYDLAGNPRVSNGLIDMGAYEFMWTGVETPEPLSLEVFPNPTRGKFKVQSSRFKVEFQSLALIDIYGKILETRNSESGTRNPGFDIGHLPAGVYFVRLSCDHQVIVKKVIKK